MQTQTISDPKQVLERAAARSEWEVVEHKGISYSVHRDVLSISDSKSGDFIASQLPVRLGDKVLDMGTGCGVIAVRAFELGATVTACDINPHAIAGLRQTLTKNNLVGIEAVQSDLFANIDRSIRYDVITFNLPFWGCEAPIDGLLAQAMFDPGYETQLRFLHSARDYLTTEGRLVLGFSNQYGLTTLYRNLERMGWEVESEHRQQDGHERIVIIAKLNIR